MQVQAQNKIFYKGNPYTRQNYIPTSALKNRKPQSFLVQFPQGQSYFSVSRKKQYSGLHNQSQIKQIGIFQPETPNNYNHGTYDVDDIEGAVPNTLVSEAIKNRMKANSRQVGRAYRKPKAFYDNQDETKYNQFSEYQAQQKQLQARFSTKNYHYQGGHKKMRTEPSEAQKNIQYQLEYRNNPENKYLQQSSQTQSANIKQLQQMLFKNQQNRIKERSNLEQQKLIKPPKHATVPHNINIQQQQYNKLSDKKIEVPKIQTPKRNIHKSAVDVKQMWHGDHHRLLFPNSQIRKLNPTYLSTDNYSSSGQVYSNYLRAQLS